MKNNLIVLDSEETLPPTIMDSLKRVCDVVRCRSVQDLKDRLQAASFQGSLIVAGGDRDGALAAAAHVKRTHPATAVIVLGSLRSPQSAHEAFSAGVDAIVDAGDAALVAAVVTRLRPGRVAS